MNKSESLTPEEEIDHNSQFGIFINTHYQISYYKATLKASSWHTINTEALRRPIVRLLRTAHILQNRKLQICKGQLKK